MIHTDLPKAHDPGFHFIQFQIESLPLGQGGGDTRTDPAKEGEEQSAELGFPLETPGHGGFHHRGRKRRTSGSLTG